MLARLVAEAAGRYLEDVRHESVRVSFADGGGCVVQDGAVRASAWRDLGLPFEVESARFAELRMRVGWSWRGFETSASFHVDRLDVVVRPFGSLQEARRAALVKKRADVRTRVDRADRAEHPERETQAWAARILTRMLETASVTVTNLSIRFAEAPPGPALCLRIGKIHLRSARHADSSSSSGGGGESAPGTPPRHGLEPAAASAGENAPARREPPPQAALSPLAHKLVTLEDLVLALAQDDEYVCQVARAEATIQVDATINHPVTGAPSLIVDLACPEGIVSPQLSTEMLETLLRLGQRWIAFADGDFHAAVQRDARAETAPDDNSCNRRDPAALWQRAIKGVTQLWRKHRRWNSDLPHHQEARAARTRVYIDALARGIQTGPWMDSFVAECPIDLLVKAHLDARASAEAPRRDNSQGSDAQSDAASRVKQQPGAEPGWASWLRSLLPDDAADQAAPPSSPSSRQDDTDRTYRWWITFTAPQMRVDLVDDHGFPICTFSGAPSFVVRQNATLSRVNAAVDSLRVLVHSNDILHVIDASTSRRRAHSDSKPSIAPKNDQDSGPGGDCDNDSEDAPFFDTIASLDENDHPTGQASDTDVDNNNNNYDDDDDDDDDADMDDDDDDNDEFHDAASVLQDADDHDGAFDNSNAHANSPGVANSPQAFVPLQRSKSDEILMGHAPLRVMTKRSLEDPDASSVTIIVEPTEVDWAPQTFRALAAFANSVSNAIGVSRVAGAGLLLHSLQDHARVRVRFGAPRIRFDAETSLLLGALAINTKTPDSGTSSPDAPQPAQRQSAHASPAIEIAFQGTQLLRKGRVVLGPVSVNGTLRPSALDRNEKRIDLRVHGGSSPQDKEGTSPHSDATFNEDLCAFFASLLREVTAGSAGSMQSSELAVSVSRSIAQSSPTLGWRRPKTSAASALAPKSLVHIHIEWDTFRVNLDNKGRTAFFFHMERAHARLRLFDLDHFEISSADAQVHGLSCKHPNGRALLAQCALEAIYESGELAVTFSDRPSLAWVPPAMADAWGTLQCLGLSEEYIQEAMASTLIPPRHRSVRNSSETTSAQDLVAGFATAADTMKMRTRVSVTFPQGCSLTLFKLWEPLAKLAVDRVSLLARPAGAKNSRLSVSADLDKCTLFNLRAGPGPLREILTVQSVNIKRVTATDQVGGAQQLTARVGAISAVFWQPFVTEWIDYATTGIFDLFAFSASENVLSSSRFDWIRTVVEMDVATLRIPSDALGTHVLRLRLDATKIENALQQVCEKDVFDVCWSGIRLEATSGACILDHKQVSVQLERSLAENTSLIRADLANFHFNILEDGFDDIISCLRDNLLNQTTVLNALLNVRATTAKPKEGAAPPTAAAKPGIRYWRNWIETKSRPQRMALTVSAISARLLNRIVVSLDLFEAITLSRFVPSAHDFMFENEYALRGLEVSVAGLPIVRSVSRMDASELLHGEPVSGTNEFSLRLNHDPERHVYVASLALDNFAIVLGPEAPDQALLQQLHKSLQWQSENEAPTAERAICIETDAGKEVQLELEMTGARLGLADELGNRLEIIFATIGNATTTTIEHGENSRIDKGSLHVDLSAALTDGQIIHHTVQHTGAASSYHNADPGPMMDMAMTMSASMLAAMDADPRLDDGEEAVCKPRQNAPMLLRPCSLDVFWDIIDRAAAAEVLTQQVRVELTSQVRLELAPGQALACLGLASNLEKAFVFAKPALGHSEPGQSSQLAPQDVVPKLGASHFSTVFSIPPLGLKLGPCAVPGPQGTLLEVRGFAKQCEESVTLEVAPGDQLVSVNGEDITAPVCTLDAAKQALRDASWPRRICFRRPDPVRALVADPLQFRPLSTAIWTCRNCKSAQPVTKRDRSAAFEETCLRCGAAHIQLSAQGADEAGEGSIVKEEVFENQRFYLLVGWSPQLLPTDPYPWSDFAGLTPRQVDAHAPLPASTIPGAKWYWVDDWTVDESRCRGGSTGGWAYSREFGRFRKLHRPPRGKPRRTDCVRQRCWVRRRVLSSTPISANRGRTAATAASPPSSAAATGGDGEPSALSAGPATQYSFLLDTNQHEISILLESDAVHRPLVRMRVGVHSELVPASWTRAIVFGTDETQSPSGKGNGQGTSRIHDENTGAISQDGPSALKAMTFLPRRLAGNLCVTAEAFNVGILDWEPIVEPWAFAFEAQHEISWNLTLMGLSRLRVNVGLAIADAVAQLPSWGPLGAGASSGRHEDGYGSTVRSRAPLLALENRSGVTITASPAGDNPNADFDVDPGATIAAMQLLGSDTAAFDLWHNIGRQRGGLDDSISLRFFGGWKALEKISLRQLMHDGEIVAHTLQQASSNESGTVLLRVDAGPDGQRVIHVESIFHIVNECDFTLSIRLQDTSGQGTLMVDPCAPSGTSELPLVKNLELRMLLLGVVGEKPRSGFVLNLAHLSSSALEMARANLAKAVSPPGVLMEQNITELAPGKHVLIDVRAEAIKESKGQPRAIARKYAACKITIGARAPRTVRNALRSMLEVRAEPNKTAVHAIEPGKTVPLYHLDEVALSFRIPSISTAWSAWVKVADLASRGVGVFGLVDCHGREVRVPLSFRGRRVSVGPGLHLEDCTWGLGLQVGLVSATTGRPLAMPGQAVTDSVAVAEFQRWLPMQGWKPPSLPGDPGPWAFHPENAIAVGDDGLAAVPLEPGWAWAEPEWRCDSSSHDWEYATDFQSQRWSLTRGKLDCARRRIWRRACVRDVDVGQVFLGPVSSKWPKGKRRRGSTQEGARLGSGRNLGAVYDDDDEEEAGDDGVWDDLYESSDWARNNGGGGALGQPEAAGPTPGSKHAVQLVLRLSGQAAWSRPIALIPGTCTPVEVEDALSDTIVSLVVQVPVLLQRESITIWNQYALRNTIEGDAVYVVSTRENVRADEVPETSRATKVQPGETVRRFHWDRRERGRFLRVGRTVQVSDGGLQGDSRQPPQQEILWSGPIDPNILDDTVLMLRDPRGLRRALVHVSIREDSRSRAVVVRFGETLRNTPQAPYRIENRTLYEIECRQLGAFSESLAPLVVKDRRVCMFGLESATGAAEGKVRVRALTEGGTAVQAVVHLLGDVNAQQKELEPVDSPENRVVVRVFAEGAARVICVAHAWAIVEAPPYVDERVALSARCELQAGVTLSLIGIHRELLAVHVEGLSVSGAETDILRTVDCRLSSLQVDDADPNTRVPVMMHQGPVHLGVATYVRFSRRIKLLSLRLFPLAIHLAKQQIRTLSQFYEVLSARARRRLGQPQRRSHLGRLESKRRELAHELTRAAEDRLPYSLDVVHVHAVNARVSLTSSSTTKSLPLAELVRRRSGSESHPRKRGSASVSALEVVGAAIARVTDLDDVQLPYWAVALGHLLRSDLRDHDVYFAELVLHHTTVYEFETSAIAQHYIAQLAKGLASTALVGSGLVRVPLHLARNLSMGVSGVMARGPRSSLEDGASGLVVGTAVLSESVFKGLARGLATMSLSDEYIRRRQDREERMRERRTGSAAPGFREALNEGALIVRNSVSEGVVGLLAEPVQGARDYGPMGFIGGIGKGFVGAAIKPVMGVLDAATVATQSVRSGSGAEGSGGRHHYGGSQLAEEDIQAQSLDEASRALRHRKRLPRALYGAGLRVAPYMEADAAAAARLRSLHGGKFTSEVFYGRFRPSRGEEVEYIVTDRQLLCFGLQNEGAADSRTSASPPLWGVDFGDIQSVAVTRDPSSGVHIRVGAASSTAATASRFVACPPDEAHAFCSLLLTAPRG